MDELKPYTHPVSKYQLSQDMEISPSTLRKLLNITLFEELEQKYLYRKTNKILYPRLANYILSQQGYID